MYKEYEAPTESRSTRIVAAAILQNGRVWTGRRHFELIQQVKEDGGERVSQDQQGFWTDDDRFVMRTAALTVAIMHGQIEEKNLIRNARMTSMAELVMLMESMDRTLFLG